MHVVGEWEDQLELRVELELHQVSNGAEGPAVAGLLGGDERAPAGDPVDQPFGHELLVGPTDRLAAQAVLLGEGQVGGQRVVVGVVLAVDALPQELRQHPVGALTVTSATNFQDLLLPPECGSALECPAIL